MTNLSLRLLSVFTLLLAYSTISYAQKTIKVSLDSDAWKIEAQKHEFVDFKGKKSLYLQGGKAHLKEAVFKNGIIDFDVYFEQGRKFIGVHFRVQDMINYEEFYMRAHQSGNPDAMQYTPVFNGSSAWQLYHGEGYSNAYKYQFGEWMHVRLIVADNKMDVFINDMSKPILHAHELKRSQKAGSIGFWTLLGGAYYANLTYQELDNPTLVSKSKIIPRPAPEVIQKWMLSNPISDKDIASTTNLKKGLPKLNWKKLNSEYSGTINLARVSGIVDGKNTILAKVNIKADEAQIKRLDFGYSDIAKVFVNGKVAYTGQRLFRSRDYRYLGTIGYFDALYLDLKKGNNEIVFAISENMGGWGLKAKLEDLNGLSIE